MIIAIASGKGGTGKTTLVAYLVDILKDDRRPAVLIRGYGSDEDRMLTDKLEGVPVISGRDRIISAYKAIDEKGCNVLVLDDGLDIRRCRTTLRSLVVCAGIRLSDTVVS